MSTSDQGKLLCYNKGCGKNFLADEDGPDSCVYHPGAPVFHDALKGWSCCKRRTTDFTEFLNTPGCSKGRHNKVKPAEEPKPQKNESNATEAVDPVPHRKPLPPADAEEKPRPSPDEPMSEIRVSVDPSLRKALEKLSLNSANAQNSSGNKDEIDMGTACKNKGCQETYQGPSSSTDRCRYHSGAAIFHEGMKYWSCCNRKTSDFNNFLNQEGCSFGDHVFKKEESAEKKLVSCRHDWHQTGKVAVLSVYCKKADPSVTVIKANQVCLDVHITFDQGRSEFQKKINLEGDIDPTKSVVTMLGTKVEIKLHKAESIAWKTFEV